MSERKRDSHGEVSQLHAQVRALFHELYELTPKEREDRLDGLATPARIRAELAELFANVERPDSLQESRLGELGDVLLLTEEDEVVAGIPERIGDYVVLGKLGEGGMGVVYSARREPAGEPAEEAVAIKVIQAGVNAQRLSSRFRREIQVLEQLRHPGIAAFHGAGQASVRTSTGETTLPYLVMELVDGAALLEHAEHESLTSHDRIELAVRICSALHHAHERSIVHRDLKPANILVERGDDDDPIGQPKILDFGVALSTDTNLATLTATQTGALVGTLPYMSPEQVDGSGRTLDRRADVYSVGVLMFELLSGQLPYDVRDRPLIEAARVIAEVEPTRLGAVAPHCDGALEAIVGKALEKDRAHRYPSAETLAEDLRRYLRGDSVLARRPSLGRELGKFARRHRVFFATATGVVVALALGLASSIRFAMGEAEARRTAEERTRAASWNLYRSKLRAATGAITAGDVGLAELELAQAPEEHRGWEWELLESRLDASVRQLTIGDGSFSLGGQLSTPIVFHPDGSSLFIHDLQSETCFSWDLTTGASTSFELPGPAAIDPGATRLVEIVDGTLVLSSFPERRRLASVPLPNDLEPVAWRGLSFAGEDLVLVRTNSGTHSIACQGGELGRLDPYHDEESWHSDAEHRWVVSTAKRTGLVVTNRASGDSWSVSAADDPAGRWLAVRVSPDGTHAAGISQVGRITSWTLTEAKGPTLAWRREARSAGIRALAISPDSSRMIAAGEAIDVFDARTGERLQTLSSHRSPVRTAAFSRDGSQLGSVDKDGNVRLWRLDGDPHVIRMGDYLYVAEFDPSGERLFLGTADGQLIAYDARSLAEIGRTRLSGSTVTSVSFDAGGERCAVTVNTGGQLVETFVLDAATGVELWTRQDQHIGRLSSAFSPDGRNLVVAGSKGDVAIYDAITGDVRVEASSIGNQRGIVPALAVHPTTGEILCGADGAVDAYDPTTLARSERFQSQGGLVTGVAFSPDGELVATGSDDGTIQVWSVRSREVVAELLGHAQRVLSVCWSPDGSKLFSGSRDTTVKVWDTQRWTDVAALTDHGDYVFSVRMSSDGKTLLSCGGDGTARVWRAETRAERWEEQLHYQAPAERMTPLVEELVATSGIAGAEDAIRRRAGLSPREREIALQLLFVRGLVAGQR